jgi:hypothetical protein
MSFLTWSSEHLPAWAEPTPDESGYRKMSFGPIPS